MKKAIIVICLLSFMVPFALADVGKGLKDLTVPTNSAKQSEAFHNLMKTKKENDISRIRKYLDKKNLPESTKIDVIIILYNIHPDKKHWSEQLYKYLPKTKDGFWSLDNNYRLFEILNVLKKNVAVYEDETAWKYIRLYNGFSDGYISEAFGPIYEYLLKNKTDLFIKYLTHESLENIRDIVTFIMPDDKSFADNLKNILTKKEDDLRNQMDVVFKLRIYIEDYKINQGYYEK